MNKIELMHELFGSGHPTDKCGTCKNLVRHTYSRNYFKCKCYGDTASEATDWRKSYPSCGLYNMAYDGIPIIELKKHMKRPKDEDAQIAGQMSIFDLVDGSKNEC